VSKNSAVHFVVKAATAEMFPAWKELAREVEPLFEAAMVEDQELNQKIIGSIKIGDVFTAVDSNGKVAGITIISREKNKIAWLAVFERCRGKGAGALLLERAIAELDAARTIEVVTFREDNKEGLPARRLYQKFGFQDLDSNYYYNGFPRCLMGRLPQRQ
jgi:ribosomal protein S18 acetylase RimI-like enzyme